MKKLALASAVAVASISAAHAAPTVYGKAFMTVDYVDTSVDSGFRNAYNSSTVANPANSGSASNSVAITAGTLAALPSSIKTTKLGSNASRIGVKGSEPITANTDVVYQLEYGVDVDTNNNTGFNGQPQSQFYSRNTFLGVSNKQYGTVLAGRMDTPFRTSKGDVDVFNAYSTTLGLDVAGGTLGELRANNAIAYVSPKLYNMPLTFSAAVSLSENDSVNRAAGKNLHNTNYMNGAIDNSLIYGNLATVNAVTAAAGKAPLAEQKAKDNGFSTSLVYDKDGIYGGLGYDKNVGIEDSAWRVTGAVDLGKRNMVPGLTLGAMYQNVNVYDRKDASKTWLVSGKYKVANTPWTVKAQYVNTDNGSNSSSTTAYSTTTGAVTNVPYLTDVSRGNYLGLPSKITEIALGGEYAFNKNTTGVIYAGRVDRDNIAKTTIVGGGLSYNF